MSDFLRACHVIAVPDLDALEDVLCSVLGFETETIDDPGWRFFHSGAATIMAGHCPDALPADRLGDHSYFAYFQVHSAGDLYRKALAAGLDCIKPLRAEPWGMSEFALRLPSGHRVMFGSRTPDV